MISSRTAVLIGIIVLSMFSSACGATATPALPTATPLPAALTFERLQNMEYKTGLLKEGVITLSGGRAERSGASGGASDKVTIALVPPFAAGDLNGDGAPDAVSFLSGNTGGSGTFIDMVVVVYQAGTPRHVASVTLGDRVRLHSVAIAGGQISVNLTVHEPSDPACCPTRDVTRIYRLDGSALALVSETPVTRPTVTALAGTQWTLVAFGAPGAETPVVPGTTITADFAADGKLSGSAGCNRYNGGYTLTGSKLAISALGSTKMACQQPDGTMLQETAFLGALQSATQLSIQGSTLTLMDASGKPVLRFWLGAWG